MDRVIAIGCLLLVFTGLIIGLNINAAGSLLSSLSSIATIVGGFATLAALYWAYITYYDWRKTHKNKEYDALIELGKSSALILKSTVYLSKTMLLTQYKYDHLSDLEHKHRDGRIDHCVNIFEKNIERYSDSRALVGFLEYQLCPESDYEKLDLLVNQISEWFWLFHSENINPTMIQQPKDNRIEVYNGVEIPESQKVFMASLDFDNAFTLVQFHSIFSSKLNLTIKEMTSKLSKS